MRSLSAGTPHARSCVPSVTAQRTGHDLRARSIAKHRLRDLDRRAAEIARADVHHQAGPGRSVRSLRRRRRSGARRGGARRSGARRRYRVHRRCVAGHRGGRAATRDDSHHAGEPLDGGEKLAHPLPLSAFSRERETCTVRRGVDFRTPATTGSAPRCGSLDCESLDVLHGARCSSCQRRLHTRAPRPHAARRLPARLRKRPGTSAGATRHHPDPHACSSRCSPGAARR